MLQHDLNTCVCMHVMYIRVRKYERVHYFVLSFMDDSNFIPRRPMLYNNI